MLPPTGSVLWANVLMCSVDPDTYTNVSGQSFCYPNNIFPNRWQYLVFMSLGERELSITYRWQVPHDGDYFVAIHQQHLERNFFQPNTRTLRFQFWYLFFHVRWWGEIFIPVQILVSISVTSLGYFWKFLVTNFLTQEAQMKVDFLGCFENIHFHV